MKTLEGIVEWEYNGSQDAAYVRLIQDDEDIIFLDEEMEDFNGKKVKITIEEITHG